MHRKQFPGYLLDEKVEKRGDAAFLYHGALTAGKWRDKRDVHFMSTLLRGDMESITRHLQQGCSETIDKPKYYVTTIQTCLVLILQTSLWFTMHVAGEL